MNTPPSQGNACIYCSGTGPFSAEHVIPAGMGGDDKNFVLHDVVCKNCNTTIFSPLEAAFLRNSPTAIGRMFMQSQGRRRGSKTNPPTLDATSKVLVSEDGYPTEIELGQNGKPFVLPQLILVGENTINSTATTKNELLCFIDSARNQLGDSVVCIQKNTDQIPATFDLTNFIWSGKSYVQSQVTEQVAKAPSIGIWREQMENSKSEQRLSRSRLFQSLKNRIVLRVTDDLELAEALTVYRKCLEQTDFSTVYAESSKIENPLVSVGMSMRIDVMDRVLAKIGINMLAYVAGAEYVRHAGFDDTKKSVLSGSPKLFSAGMEEHDVMNSMLSRLPLGQHLFMIFGGHHPSEGYVLALTVKLYGSQVTTIRLGVNLPKAPLHVPIVFIVDYAVHLVRKLDLIEFVQIFGPFGSQMQQEKPA